VFCRSGDINRNVALRITESIWKSMWPNWNSHFVTRELSLLHCAYNVR